MTADRFGWEPGDVTILEPGESPPAPDAFGIPVPTLADLRASFGNDDNRLAQYMTTPEAEGLPEVLRQQVNGHLFHGSIMKMTVIPKAETAKPSPDLERLAALEHAQWVMWSKTLADRGDVDAGVIERWKPNWIPYDQLTDDAKEQDRIWARRALASVSKSDEGSATAIAARDRIESEIAKYRDDQARDDHGRWTTEGGGEMATTASKPSTAAKPSYPKAMPAQMNAEQERAIGAALQQPWKAGGEFTLPAMAPLHDEVKVATPDTPEFKAATQGVLDSAKANEPAITAAIQGIVTATGGMTVGLEHRLKTDESVTRKVFSNAQTRAEPYPVAAAAIADAVRYTVVYPDKTYTESTNKAIAALHAQYTNAKTNPDGTPRYGVNYWDPKTAPDGKHPEYMGINTWWKTPGGQKFEVQFHTPRSILTKEVVSHPLYERARVPNLPPSQLQKLTNSFRTIWQKADHVPSGITMLSL